MVYPFAILKRIPRILLAVFLCFVFVTPTLAQTVDPNDKEFAEQMRRQGQQAQDQGDYSQALFYYLRAAAFLPDNAPLQNSIGLMYEKTGKHEDALAAYESAIKIDSQYLPVYSNLGAYYRDRGYLELAALNFETRVRLGKPTDPWTLRAQEELEAIYEKKPELKSRRTFGQADMLAQEVARVKNHSRAVKARERDMAYEVPFQMGMKAYKARRYAEAEQLFAEALSVKPDSSEARHVWERAQADIKREKAAQALQETLEQERGMIVSRYLTQVETRPFVKKK